MRNCGILRTNSSPAYISGRFVCALISCLWWHRGEMTHSTFEAQTGSIAPHRRPPWGGFNASASLRDIFFQEESGAEMFVAGWILLGGALVVSQLPLVSSHLNCSVTKQLDGSFLYELPEPHDSTCDTSWEDVHNKVIALNSDRDETLVQNLTNQSITMKTCSDLLRYTVDCSGVQVMTNCSVNCTRFSEQEQNTTRDPVNPELICFTVDWCVTRVTFGLCVIAVAAVVAVITVVVCLFIYKPRCVRQKDSVSYSAPSETVKIELESIIIND